jgi:hypothetical protein
MAIGDYDERGRLAARARRESEAGMSGIAIALGLLVGALLIGLLAYIYTDRTPPGSTATSEPAVTSPQTQPKTTAPPANTTTTPPSTK